jgi:hypothetical protein
MNIKTCSKKEKGGCRWRCNIGGKKKDLVNKNHGWNPSNKSTRQMRTQVHTTQRKNKSKQSTKNR